MSTSNQTYKQYSFSDHEVVYQLLESVFSNYSINYYLIGANARDAHLYKQGIKPIRGTADIDFAIMVPDFEVYNNVFNELCNLGFRKTKEQYRLIFDKTNTVLDLMPYGEIEEEYTVNFTDRELTLSVLGFKEVGEVVETIEIKEGGFTLPVSPIEGILILKLVSWSEKPDSRTKDLEDISFLIEKGWQFYEEEAYEKHLDLFDDDDFEMTKAAARIIGRKMKPILKANDKLYQTIVTVLEKSISEKNNAENHEIVLAQNMNKTIEEIQNILAAILNGIND